MAVRANSSVLADAVGVAGATIAGMTYGFAGTVPIGAASFGSTSNERQLQNVAAGRLAAASTDAVNGSQLFAMNSAVNSLATGIVNGGIGPVRYSNPATRTTPNGGAPGQNLTLGATSGQTVTLSNVAPAELSATSTDAVNGGQLATTNQRVDTLEASVGSGSFGPVERTAT